MGLKVDTIQNPTSATVNLTLDTSGNVGIGTASPGQRLDLGGGSLTLYNSTGPQQVYLYRASATNYSSIGTDSSAGGVTFTTGTSAPSERMRIDSSGNVGIGVVPSYQLELKSANDAILRFVNSGATQVSQIQSTNLARSAYAPLSIGGSYTVLETGGSERMRIDSSGIVTGTAGNLMLVNLAKVNLSSTATALSTTIPSWAKKITLAINGLSSNGTADYQVQIGYVGQAAGTYVTTGYTSFSNVVASTGGATTSTSGFVIRNNEGAAQTSYGHMTLTLQDSATNTWVSSHSMGCTNGAGKYELIGGGGVVALAGVLDRIQITAGGTDLLDAGSINIQYE